MTNITGPKEVPACKEGDIQCDEKIGIAYQCVKGRFVKEDYTKLCVKEAKIVTPTTKPIENISNDQIKTTTIVSTNQTKITDTTTISINQTKTVSDTQTTTQTLVCKDGEIKCDSKYLVGYTCVKGQWEKTEYSKICSTTTTKTNTTSTTKITSPTYTSTVNYPPLKWRAS